MARIGFHRLGSEFATPEDCIRIRSDCSAARPFMSLGLAAPGTHNTGVALIEVTQADGPRIVVNNEEERFSGNKHTTEYPQRSIDAHGRDAARDRARRRRYRRDRHDAGIIRSCSRPWRER